MTPQPTPATPARRERPPAKGGPVYRPKAGRVLTVTVVGAAVVVAVLGMIIPLHRPEIVSLSPPGAIGVAVVLVVAAQLARLRFRVGRGTVSVSWGETAFILGFALAPPGWLPAATLLGAVGCLGCSSPGSTTSGWWPTWCTWPPR